MVAAATLTQTTSAKEIAMWFRSLFESLGSRSPGRLWKRSRANTVRPRTAKRRLVLEEMEGRTLLSTVFTAVAAGDPTSDSAILWTRALDPVAPGPIQLTANISTDPSFGAAVHTFSGVSDPSRDYTVKLDATGWKATSNTTTASRAPTDKRAAWVHSKPRPKPRRWSPFISRSAVTPMAAGAPTPRRPTSLQRTTTSSPSSV